MYNERKRIIDLCSGILNTVSNAEMWNKQISSTKTQSFSYDVLFPERQSRINSTLRGGANFFLKSKKIQCHFLVLAVIQINRIE